LQSTVTSLNVLSLDESAGWADEVRSLERFWTRREESVPFFTLGLAAYLDADLESIGVRSRRPYHLDSFRHWNNRLLRQHFGPLLDRCCNEICAWSGWPAACEDAVAALPGFHIHLPHPAFANEVASRHVDVQFRKVFGIAQPDPGSVMTFTLPVAMPRGAGLRIWEQTGRSSDHAYTIGTLAIHDGLSMHQAILNPHHEPTARIMLQGHGLLTSKGWRLYW
jgi:hypothetical protein